MTRSESSVVVSLAELMRLENERVQTEASIAQQREAERHRAEASEREAMLAREAEEHAAAVEQERREQAREREEQVRLQSIRDAHLEGARREAEIRVQADGRAAARERALSDKLRRASIVIWAVLIASTTLLIACIVLMETRADGRLDQMRRAQTRKEEQWEQARRADQERVQLAEERLGAVRAELERKKNELAPPIERPREPRRSERDPRKREALPLAQQPRCAPCPPGDPLCGCLEP